MALPDDRRDYPTRPFIGVLAVVRRSDSFLLICRGRQPNKGLWGFPGGVQELGETIVECAGRELVEETGVSAADLRILPPFDVIERDPEGGVEFHFLLVPVILDWIAGEGTVSEEATALGWFEENQVSTLPALPMVRDIMAAARR